MNAAKRKTVAHAPTAENGNAGPGSTRFPYIVNLLLLVITLALNLTMQEDPRYWNRFRDVKDYLQQSRQPLLSSDFFMPRYINSRPFTVPLFYKAAGINPRNIVFMQIILHSLSTCFISYALLLFIRNKAGQYLMMFFIYSLMSWWCILGWTLQLLSESLTVSLLFCWIASFLLFYKKRRPAFLIFHLLSPNLYHAKIWIISPRFPYCLNPKTGSVYSHGCQFRVNGPRSHHPRNGLPYLSTTWPFQDVRANRPGPGFPPVCPGYCPRST